MGVIEKPPPLYHYMKADHALQVFETKQIKLSLLNKLNDPFEFDPGFTNSENIPIELYNSSRDEILKRLASKIGIICFSSENDNLLMWSHYADSHSGIVLDFGSDTPDNCVQVEYEEERPSFDFRVALKGAKGRTESENKELEDFNTLMSYTKSDGWEYEDEYRYLIDLDGESCIAKNGMYFWNIEPEGIRRVILGIKCQYSREHVERYLKQRGYNNTEVVCATKDRERYAVNIPPLMEPL